MKISGFSYVRNGFKYGYPFLQSIQSILPICDEFVIAVGESEDGTKEAIQALNTAFGGNKIKIIDTVWDENLRLNGQIFAQQANIALKEITGDWAFHIQADEIIHENDLQTILNEIKAVDDNKNIDGILLDFLNFYGNYDYLNDTRDPHKKEIRLFRNHRNVYSYRDSQGFRRYPSEEIYLNREKNKHKGIKLKVAYLKVPVFHYSYVRSPQQMKEKSKYFETFWHEDKYIQEKYEAKTAYDYYDIARVKRYEGTHPAIMAQTIAENNWDFDPSKLHKKLSLKYKFIYWLEDLINYRIGEYKNYVIV